MIHHVVRKHYPIFTPLFILRNYCKCIIHIKWYFNSNELLEKII